MKFYSKTRLKIKGIDFGDIKIPQLAEITTPFPDWWRLLHFEKW